MIRTAGRRAWLSDAFWATGRDRAQRLGRQLGKLAQQVDRPEPGLGAIDGDSPPDGAPLGHRRGRHGADRRLRAVEQMAGPSTALKVVDDGRLVGANVSHETKVIEHKAEEKNEVGS